MTQDNKTEESASYTVALEWLDAAGTKHGADDIQLEAVTPAHAVCQAWRTHASGFRVDEPDPYAKAWVRDSAGVTKTYNCGPRPSDSGYRSLGVATGPTSAMLPSLGPSNTGEQGES